MGRHLCFRAFLYSAFLLCCTPAAALSFFNWGKKEEFEPGPELWQSRRQYIRIETRVGGDDVPPNQHPAELDEQVLRRVLSSLMVRHRTEGFFGFGEKEEDPLPVFTPQMVELLSRHAAEAFPKLEPSQELSFVLFGYYGGRLFNDKKAIGGRLFYLDDRLQLLLGDVHRSVYFGPGRDFRGIEWEADVRLYPYKTGRRGAAPAEAAWTMVLPEGAAFQKVGGEARFDWLAINTAAFPTLPAAALQPATGAATPAPSDESLGRLREESRQLKLEFARLRKYIRELEQGANAGEAPELVEKRLMLLQKLRARELISEEEYQAKRAHLLEEL